MTQNHSAQQTSHKRCIGRKKPEWWLLLLGREASENRVEDKVYIVFLGGRAFQGGLGLKELCGLILRQTQGLGVGFFSLGWGLDTVLLQGPVRNLGTRSGC